MEPQLAVKEVIHQKSRGFIMTTSGIKNFFATRWGVIITGALIGVIAPFLQKLGNPPNMGVCVACFERDISGALGLHRAGVVQYIRPEIIGLVLGALIAALLFREFKPRGGSAPIARFMLGFFAMAGALVFLGCPWRALLRLAGGDWNAILGILGLAFGIWIGTLFMRSGYSLGKSSKASAMAGWILPLIVLGLLILRLVYPQLPKPAPVEGVPEVESLASGILFYSLKGPGSMHTPLIISLIAALFIGFIAQRSRFCTMGAIRDLVLFGQTHLFGGIVALWFVAMIVNLALGQFHPGFANQPIAHTMHFWNFTGMVLAGLAFALAGGCPGRQLFMSGEGDMDAGVFVIGMLVGGAFAHNFSYASSPTGIGVHGMTAVIVGLLFCIILGFTMKKTLTA